MEVGAICTSVVCYYRLSWTYISWLLILSLFMNSYRWRGDGQRKWGFISCYSQSLTMHSLLSTLFPGNLTDYLSNYWLPKHKCNLPEYKLFTVSKQCSLMVPMQLTFISDLETPSGQWNQQIHTLCCQTLQIAIFCWTF